MAGNNKLIHALNKYLADFQEAEPEKMAELAEGRWEPPNIYLPFLNGEVAVNWETGAVTPETPSILEHILILKYLLAAQGMDAALESDEYIAFRQLPYGSHHLNAFKAEVLNPLAAAFGGDLPGFAAAAQALGGVKAPGGDLAYTIPYFPKIGLRIIIWQADEEFPAQSAFLFNKRSQFHMDTDGLNELANSLTAILLREAGK